MRFRPEQHLRRQSDIRAVREKGRRIDCRAFTIWWKRRDDPSVVSPSSAAPASLAGSLLPAEPASSAAAAIVSPTPRVCVIASTAAVGNAVHRNRAKRRLRETFRRQQHLVPADCDLLLIARAAATNSHLGELQKKFSDACAQISKP